MSTGKMLSIASEGRLSGTKANSLHRYMYYCQQLQSSPPTSRTLFHWGGGGGGAGRRGHGLPTFWLNLFMTPYLSHGQWVHTRGMGGAKAQSG